MTTSAQLSQSCQVCGKPFQPDVIPKSIWDRLCSGCSQKQQGTKYYARSVMLEKPKQSEVNEQPIGKGKEGVKDDKGKFVWDFSLLPWEGLKGVMGVLIFGAKKYAPGGWRTVPNGRARYEAAFDRHLVARASGEVYDPESGIKHIDHMICNLVFLSELEGKDEVQS